MTILSLLILIVSIIAHEVAHGVAALWQGDTTAKDANRLTLNPLAHIDPIGSIVVPLVLSLTPSPFIFGWAKPVPINPYRFRNLKYGEAMVAFAGPLTNLIFVAIFSILLHTVPMSDTYTAVAQTIVLINLVLALFNLMPVPPLDGSKILFTLIPAKYYKFRESLESKSFIFWFIIIMILWNVTNPVVYWLFERLV